MKYLVTVTPGPLPPSPELFDAAFEYLDAKLADGTFDCVYGLVDGGGFSVVNADSNADLQRQMTEYPLYGMVEWDAKPVVDYREGFDALRGKLVEAQAMMGGGQA